jgi:hypothetical protein
MVSTHVRVRMRLILKLKGQGESTDFLRCHCYSPLLRGSTHLLASISKSPTRTEAVASRAFRCVHGQIGIFYKVFRCADLLVFSIFLA